MPRCLVTQEALAHEQVIPAHIDGELIGYISREVYSERWDEPEHKQLSLGE